MKALVFPRFFSVSLCAAMLAVLCFAQGVPNPRPAPLNLTQPIRDKNFYVLSLLERDPEAKKAIEADVSLARLANAKREGFEHAADTCGEDNACLHAAFRFSEADIVSAADALRQLYAGNSAIHRLTDGALRDSGAYIRYNAEPGADALAHAWRDAAAGINRLISIYGEGARPRSGEIDAVAYDVTTPAFRLLLRTVVAVLREKASQQPLFFQPSLDYGLYLLDLSRRDEAGRHEPMEQKDNRAAFRRIRTIRWSDYPYTAIVVPGSGTDRLSWNLSPAGKLRSELAARRFHEKKAPLILVSGGYVHPNQTPFAEAIEMKKLLMTEFGIPEDAILVDPHARHTTTNLRNAARILYRYGVPFDRKALVTTDPWQSAGIENPGFAKRCIAEMGYVPLRVLGRTSAFDLEFIPLIESLQIDPADPLDP